MVKAAAVFLFLFGLVHAEWIPEKLGVDPSAIPIGVLNIVLLFGLALWFNGIASGDRTKNPVRAYNWFVGVVILWLVVGAMFGYEEDFLTSLRTGKTQVSLLLVYYIPLALIKNERDFKFAFAAALFVHVLVGLEVARSGVLGGIHYHDMKRGSGPFGEAWKGADVAGSYLAQTGMFFVGGVLLRSQRLIHRVLFAGVGAILLLGLYATYARGALLALVVGAIATVVSRKFDWRVMAGLVVLGLILYAMIPGGSKARFLSTVQGDSALDESTQGRLQYYRTALNIAQDHPLGIGTAQIRSAMMAYTGGTKYVDPHNAFLQILCEQSLVGLAIFVVLLWRLLKLALRGAAAPDAGVFSYSQYSFCMVGFISAFVVCNLFYANFQKELVTGMVAWHFGMLSVVEEARCREESDSGTGIAAPQS